MNLFFHEVGHILLSLLAVRIVLIFLPQKKYVRKYVLLVLLGAFLGGFFVDTDHLFDYLHAFGFIFRPDYFFTGYAFIFSQKMFVFLHSWELFVLLVLIIRFTKRNSLRYFLLATGLGLFSHLVYDMYFNHITLQGYSLLFRVFHNFDAQYFITIQK